MWLLGFRGLGLHGFGPWAFMLLRNLRVSKELQGSGLKDLGFRV